MQVAITNLNNDSIKTNNDHERAKRLNHQLQQQNKSLQDNDTKQSDQINCLNVDIKSLKEAVNSLEADKQELNRVIQQKSMVSSSLNVNHGKNNENNPTIRNTRTTTTDAFTSPPAPILSPNDDPPQQ